MGGSTGASAGDGMFLVVAWLSVAALGLLVVWLGLLVIRLRFESLVNRRVIASLQKVRPINEAKAPLWQVFQALPAGIWFLLAMGVLLLLALSLE